MPNSLVSIVMPSFNQADFIELSVLSAINQDYSNIELIISDGGSTDATNQILEQLQIEHENIRWASEPDDGSSSAINKALSSVRGEIIGWLNSDDLYAKGAIKLVVDAFNANPDWIMCYGQGQHIDADGHVLGAYPTLPPSVSLRGFESGCFICQPTVFFKTSMLTLLGNLDETLKTAFDYDYWLRAFRSFPGRIGFIDSILAQSRLHEDCITVKMRETVALEGLGLGKKHLGRAPAHWATTYLEELRDQTRHDRADFLRRANTFLNKAQTHLSANDLNQLKRSIQI